MYENKLPQELLTDDITPFTLDSFDIRIPLTEVEILSDELSAKGVIVTEVDTETGIVYKEFIKDSPQKVTSGDELTKNKRTYSVQGYKTGEGKYLRINLSAKSLGSDYLKGISLDTVSALYDILISDSVASFSFESFLRGELTDFDYKRDYLFKGLLSDLLTFYQHYQSVYNANKNKVRGVSVFPHINKLNVGLEINERRYTKSIVSTFFKAYYKGGELLTEGRNFYEEYLPEVPENILRLIHRQEFTVSGKTHSKVLGLGGDTSLQGVLTTPQEDIERALSLILRANFTKEPIRMKSDKELTTREEMILGVLKHLINTVGQLQAEYILLSEITDRRRKSEVRGSILKVKHYLYNSEHSKDLKEVPERLIEQGATFERLTHLFPLDEEE